MDIRLLGPVECSGEEGVVKIPGTSAKAVLTMLALRPGEVVLSDEIIEGLWGANFPVDPIAAVHVAHLPIPCCSSIVGGAYRS